MVLNPQVGLRENVAMLSNGISAWVSKQDSLSHLCGWIGDSDSNSRCKECPI